MSPRSLRLGLMALSGLALLLAPADLTGLGLPWPGRRREFGKCIQQFQNAEVVDCRAKKHGR